MQRKPGRKKKRPSPGPGSSQGGLRQRYEVVKKKTKSWLWVCGFGYAHPEQWGDVPSLPQKHQMRRFVQAKKKMKRPERTIQEQTPCILYRLCVCHRKTKEKRMKVRNARC
jgi:hypothetical protein